MILTQSEELGEGGTLLSDVMYATTPTLSFAVMFRVTLVDVVEEVALSIVKLPVGACSSSVASLYLIPAPYPD